MSFCKIITLLVVSVLKESKSELIFCWKVLTLFVVSDLKESKSELILSWKVFTLFVVSDLKESKLELIFCWKVLTLFVVSDLKESKSVLIFCWKVFRFPVKVVKSVLISFLNKFKSDIVSVLKFWILFLNSLISELTLSNVISFNLINLLTFSLRFVWKDWISIIFFSIFTLLFWISFVREDRLFTEFVKFWIELYCWLIEFELFNIWLLILGIWVECISKIRVSIFDISFVRLLRLLNMFWCIDSTLFEKIECWFNKSWCNDRYSCLL